MNVQQALLNEVGEMVQGVWQNLPHYFPGVVLDAFVVMPDHIHGIVVLVDSWLINVKSGPARSAAPTLGNEFNQEPPLAKSRKKPIDIPTLMRRFKSFTTKQYWDIQANHHNSRLPEKLWQRSFYERIIRSDSDLEEKREYIMTNPLRRFLKTQD